MHGIRHKWSYLARTTPNITPLFQPLEDTLRQRFLPALTGLPPLGDDERHLLSLPTRLGGLGITNPATLTEEYSTSLQVTAPLVDEIRAEFEPARSGADQTRTFSALALTKNEFKRKKLRECFKVSKELSDGLPDPLRRAMVLAQ